MKYETWNETKAINYLHSGKTIKDLCSIYGFSYHRVYAFCRSRGIGGGVTKRDKRPLEIRVWQSIDKQKDGCWRWIGQAGQLSWSAAAPRTPRGLIRFVMGLKNQHTNCKTCGNQWCLNPDHESIKNELERNNEILERWKLHVQHSTTMRALGKEFGITKQRVEQIVRELNGPRKLAKKRSNGLA